MADTQVEDRDAAAQTGQRVIDADGHVRETDEDILRYMPEGYRAREKALLHFPLLPHHGRHRSDPRMHLRQVDECLLWASDFPHEATKTNLQELVDGFFKRDDLSYESKTRIIYDNARNFYGFD